MTANSATLEALHEAVATELLDIIKNGVPIKWDEETGEELARRKPSAAEFSAAVAFLKANDISADINENDATKALAEALAKRRAKSKPGLGDLAHVSIQ